MAPGVCRSRCFLMGTNATFINGELVNIDGASSGLSSLLHGPKHVVIVAGGNQPDRKDCGGRIPPDPDSVPGDREIRQEKKTPMRDSWLLAQTASRTACAGNISGHRGVPGIRRDRVILSGRDPGDLRARGYPGFWPFYRPWPGIIGYDFVAFVAAPADLSCFVEGGHGVAQSARPSISASAQLSRTTPFTCPGVQSWGHIRERAHSAAALLQISEPRFSMRSFPLGRSWPG